MEIDELGAVAVKLIVNDSRGSRLLPVPPVLATSIFPATRLIENLEAIAAGDIESEPIPVKPDGGVTRIEPNLAPLPLGGEDVVFVITIENVEVADAHVEFGEITAVNAKASVKYA